jgi:hypothetical protein
MILFAIFFISANNIMKKKKSFKIFFFKFISHTCEFLCKISPPKHISLVFRIRNYPTGHLRALHYNLAGVYVRDLFNFNRHTVFFSDIIWITRSSTSSKQHKKNKDGWCARYTRMYDDDYDIAKNIIYMHGKRYGQLLWYML